jgi:hypothetical protein
MSLKEARLTHQNHICAVKRSIEWFDKYLKGVSAQASAAGGQ